MSFIHYKFRSAREYDSLIVDGMGMPVLDVKLEIVRQKKLKGEDFELILSLAGSNEEFKDDKAMIQRNSSIIVRRVPVPDAKRRGIIAGTAKYNLDELQPRKQQTTIKTQELVPVSHDKDFKFKGIPGLLDEAIIPVKDEDDQMDAMFRANKFHWDATQEKMANLKRVRHQQPNVQRLTRQPPPMYVCYRCGVKGHYIQDCPTNGDAKFDRPKVKRTTGIPKSFLKEIEMPPDLDTQGASLLSYAQDSQAVMINSEGKIVQFVSNDAAWNKIQSQMTSVLENDKGDSNMEECKICNILHTLKVTLSCCNAVVCNDCIPLAKTEEICKLCNQNFGIQKPQVVESVPVSIKAVPSTLESRIKIRPTEANDTSKDMHDFLEALKAQKEEVKTKRSAPDLPHPSKKPKLSE